MAQGANPPGVEGISLRVATEADAEGIVRTLEAAFAPLAGRYTPAAYAATVPSAEAIRSRLRDARTWVAVEGDTIVGTVTARVTPTGVYVQSMAVAPALRRSGVGRRLLGEAVRFAEAAKARRLYLSTTPFLEGPSGSTRRAGSPSCPRGRSSCTGPRCGRWSAGSD